MPVLIDTPIWSLVLRREAKHLSPPQLSARGEVERLIRHAEARLIGSVRQELLSGIRHKEQFARIRNDLRGFPDVTITTPVYEMAAEANNACRAAGIVGSAVDYLLCAVALHYGWEIYTLDQDFQLYARIVPLRLHQGPISD